MVDKGSLLGLIYGEIPSPRKPVFPNVPIGCLLTLQVLLQVLPSTIGRHTKFHKDAYNHLISQSGLKNINHTRKYLFLTFTPIL